MVIDNYIGWPTNVNKIILDATTVDIGEGALKDDNLEGGNKRPHQRSTYVPDNYPVTMEFDWVNKDINGETEYTRFLKWYKYIHHYGTIPFEFPQILYSPETGIMIYDSASDNYKVEYYRITSALKGSKSGEKVKVTMTWQSVFTGLIQIEDREEEIAGIVTIKKNNCSLSFAVEGVTCPTSNDFTLYIDDVQTEILGFSYSDKIAKLYYSPLEKGSHTITFAYKDLYKKNDIVGNVNV